MFPVLLDLGFIKIYSYGVCIGIGILLAYFVGKKQAGKAGLSGNLYSDLVFQTMVAGFLGAKLLYIFIEWRYVVEYPFSAVRSGFVFYGGMISGAVMLLYLSNRHKLKFLKIADLFVLCVPLAHAFGRIGCFLYGCCYGKVTDSAHGLLFSPNSPAGFHHEYVFPIQLVSSAFLFFMFFLGLILYRKKQIDGLMVVFYGVVYGVFRFTVEFFRGDERGGVFGLSTSQIVSVGLVLFAVAIAFYLRVKRKDKDGKNKKNCCA